MHKKCGFTLVELLIVIVLLGFLSITGLSLFQGSQKRGRDSRRKTDLSQVAKALEMYANDYGYPAADFSTGGNIMGCSSTGTACTWGGVWSRSVGNSTTVYMQKLPKDPGGGTYCYKQVPKGYMLYATLDRTEDPDYNAGLTCGDASTYTYVLLSSNITPTPTP